MNKNLKISIGILTVAIVLFTASFYNLSVAQQYSMVANEKSPVTGSIKTEIQRAGETEWTLWDENHNLVVTQGLTRIRDFLGWDNATAGATTAIALSNDTTPAASWTKLPGELYNDGLNRTAGAIDTPNCNDTAVVFYCEFVYGGTSQAIQCAGAHWSTVVEATTLYAAGTFTQVTLEDGDKIKITYTLNSQSG